MNIFRKKTKKIPYNKLRIIKISKDALFEWIYENMIDDQDKLMDISDVTSIVSTFDINWETGEFIFIARNDGENGKGLESIDGIDTQKLLVNMKDTTTTLCQDRRFVEVSLEEILNIQNKNSSIYNK